MSGTPFTVLPRRRGEFSYSLSFIDSKTICLLEIDAGRMSPHQPSRRIAVADVRHSDELQDLCDKWNGKSHLLNHYTPTI
mgnify:CR=1 FL=1